MSVKKKKVPAQDSNPVGYGRPPVHSQLRKGQSGNPTGNRRHREAEPAQALIWKEAYRFSSNSCRTERLKPEPAGPQVQPTRNSTRTGMTSLTKS